MIGQGGDKDPENCPLIKDLNFANVAWWAAVYGVAQSRTRLKRLSSSIHFNNVKWVNFKTMGGFFKPIFPKKG